ncbi:hypothetical protein EQV77_17815 [Halobacillus fulvus]|nr:hypothetical protein EQV77_17815 [Halobacillus fulvus]
MKKGFFAFVTLSIMFLLMVPSHIFASSHDSHDAHVHDLDSIEKSEVTVLDNPSNSEVSVFYVPCPGGGKHTMVARGTGFVYIDGERELAGQTSQCTKCHTVIISENNPFYSWVDSLGWYANQGASGPVGNPTVMYTNGLFYNGDITAMESYNW